MPGDMKIEAGFIGFCDILGCSEFLEHNDATSAAKIVQSLWLPSLELAKESAKDMLPPANRNAYYVNAALDDIHYLIFADSILVYLDLCKRDSGLMYFSGLMAALYRNMFENGFPLRGAIAHGEYCIMDSCFVGEPTVEAHKIASNMDLAAIAICKSALSSMHKNQEPYFSHYLTPLAKKGEEQTEELRWLLPPSYSNMPAMRGCAAIEQCVENSFCAHKKGTPENLVPAVASKLKNTVKYFDFCKQIDPHIFDGANHK